VLGEPVSTDMRRCPDSSAADGEAGTSFIAASPAAGGSWVRRWRSFNMHRDNLIALIPDEAFEQDSFELRLLWQRYLLLNNPQEVQHVLLDHADRYARSPTLQRLFRRVLGESLITTEGDTWRRHRHVMAPAFTPRSIRRHAPLMSEAIAALVARWADMPAGTAVDLVATMRQLTLGIVARAMFSTNDPDEIEMVKDSVPGYVRGMRPGIIDLLPDWLPRPSGGRTRRMVPGLDTAVDRVIARRRSGEERTADELLSRLLAGGPENGGGMSIRQVCDHAAHFYIAGHETTEQTLVWA